MNKVRCLNCLTRFTIKAEVKESVCPHCKTKYRISWPRSDQPKIRGLAQE